METVSIIIPTYDNPDQLGACVRSILAHYDVFPVHIIIVNNGSAPLADTFAETPHVTVITTGKNLGWEGGLKEGLTHTETTYVMFANDDIFIPFASSTWLKDMVGLLEIYEDVGAVGPSSNVVMGPQNIFHGPPVALFETQFLIGFCVLFRRKTLDEIGGVDDSLPGGDDLDYSIRLRQKGFRMLVSNKTFVYHHGFQTGTKVHGGPDQAGGWNSPQMTERTNTALIKKHGFLAWWETMTPQS